MQINQQNNYIRNNTNLKAPNVTEYVDSETFNKRLQQVKKINKDIVYFAQNYFYIINLDQGKKIIKLYPKQAELVKTLTEKRRVVTLATRQCGKCVDGQTLITIRNKKTNKIQQIPIKLFFEKLRKKVSKQ